MPRLQNNVTISIEISETYKPAEMTQEKLAKISEFSLPDIGYPGSVYRGRGVGREPIKLTWDKIDSKKNMIRLNAEDVKERWPRRTPITWGLRQVLEELAEESAESRRFSVHEKEWQAYPKRARSVVASGRKGGRQRRTPKQRRSASGSAPECDYKMDLNRNTTRHRNGVFRS